MSFTLNKCPSKDLSHGGINIARPKSPNLWGLHGLMPLSHEKSSSTYSTLQGPINFPIILIFKQVSRPIMSFEEQTKYTSGSKNRPKVNCHICAAKNYSHKKRKEEKKNLCG